MNAQDDSQRRLLNDQYMRGYNAAGRMLEGLLEIERTAVRAETVAATLDACREHMGCACDGIEGHLAERGLLFSPIESQPAPSQDS